MVDFKKHMAAKKAATGETSMVKWDEKLAMYAQAASAKHQQALGQGNWIGTRAGILTYKQQKIKQPLDCVIVADTFENAFYKGKFDENNPQPPVCFAFGDDIATMKPHDASVSKQNPDCVSCPKNVFGTSETGRGKACKNIVRMALVNIVDLKKDATKAEPIFLKTTVTSRQPFARYSKDIEDNMARPLWGVVTRITTEQDESTQFKINFELEEELKDHKLFPILEKLSETQREALLIPYQPMTEAKPAAKGAPRKSNKFAKKPVKK